MTNQELLGEFLELPPEAQTEVLRLIAFLKQKHQQEESTSTLPNADLKNDPFMGMWRDRQDLDVRIFVKHDRALESTERKGKARSDFWEGSSDRRVLRESMPLEWIIGLTGFVGNNFRMLPFLASDSNYYDKRY